MIFDGCLELPGQCERVKEERREQGFVKGIKTVELVQTDLIFKRWSGREDGNATTLATVKSDVWKSENVKQFIVQYK